jgi:hypothetical protein
MHYQEDKLYNWNNVKLLVFYIIDNNIIAYSFSCVIVNNCKEIRRKNGRVSEIAAKRKGENITKKECRDSC